MLESSTKLASSSGTSPSISQPELRNEFPNQAELPTPIVVADNVPKALNIFYERPEGMKARVYRSAVWDHFTSYWVRSTKKVKNLESGVIEDVYVYKERAKCKYCPKGKGDFAADSGPNGTGGPNKHIPKRCKWYPCNVDLNKQKVLTREKGDYNKLVCKSFDQKKTMEACVEMVVPDELPFSFVEKKGFMTFCEIGMPLFILPSRRTLVRTFLDMYEARKKQLKKELASYRVCLTTDTWTSVQNINDMVLTAHFIDSNWTMHKRVLNFCVITNHQGITIANLIEQCLSDWGINKILTVTVDNASANKVALEHLAEKLNDCPNSEVILGGKYMHMRCVAHITNLIVGNGLKKLNPTILAIRNAVKFVRSSPSGLVLFKKAVAREKLELNGLVCLDVPTRWNSTYFMLDSALKSKRAFKRMEQEVDSPYLAFFNEPDEEFDEDGNVRVQRRDKKKFGPPRDADWESCESFINFLQVFYEVTLRVSASHHLTIHTSFHDIVHMEEIMNSLCACAPLSATDKLMAEIASLMKTKYNKYFGDLKNMSPFIFLGIVMDPRFKLKHVSQLLTEQLMWIKPEVEDKVSEIKSLLFQLYEEYGSNLDKYVNKRNPEASNTSNNMKRQRINEKAGNQNSKVSIGMKYVVNWTKHVIQTDEAIVEHEIDRFFKDPLLAIGDQDDGLANDTSEPCAEKLIESYKSFKILQWWKKSASHYPILSLLAKDIFAIQVSTVASESSFSTGGRVIDSFRSSLTPKSVEALICMQNWIRGDNIIMNFDEEPSAQELQFYENIETELFNTKTAYDEVEEVLERAEDDDLDDVERDDD